MTSSDTQQWKVFLYVYIAHILILLNTPIF